MIDSDAFAAIARTLFLPGAAYCPSWKRTLARIAQGGGPPIGIRDVWMRSFIYFIEAPEVGRLKVGVSNDIRRRFRQLQIASPCELRLLGLIIGDENEEACLHRRWKSLQHHREWFRFDPEMRTEVAALLADWRTIWPVLGMAEEVSLAEASTASTTLAGRR